jgi:hypothetical protein
MDNLNKKMAWEHQVMKNSAIIDLWGNRQFIGALSERWLVGIEDVGVCLTENQASSTGPKENARNYFTSSTARRVLLSEHLEFCRK